MVARDRIRLTGPLRLSHLATRSRFSERALLPHPSPNSARQRLSIDVAKTEVLRTGRSGDVACRRPTPRSGCVDDERPDAGRAHTTGRRACVVDAEARAQADVRATVRDKHEPGQHVSIATSLRFKEFKRPQ